MSNISKAGIETTADGASFIPSSQRADGSTRKEIRVRPGYRPPEDIETYKNRSAEAWKSRGKGGVPGAEPVLLAIDDSVAKSKNAKRREAARKKAAADNAVGDAVADDLTSAMQQANISEADKLKENWRDPTKLQVNETASHEAELQKKIRNQLKKLKAVRELKEKRAAGEKLSPEQIMKIGKERELLRDLKKLGYDGPEVQADFVKPASDEST